MLLAHLAPGYFATARSQYSWPSHWSRKQRALLWLVAFASTVAPDADVIYNVLFRGFFNHSVLWTHSLFPYLGLALVWWLLGRNRHWPYLQTLVGLTALGGISHILLDAIAHSTPIFYPFSAVMVGAPSARVLQGGVSGYLTDPIFLLEPLLLTLAGVHWALTYRLSPRLRLILVVILANSLLVFTVTFLTLLPDKQRALPIP